MQIIDNILEEQIINDIHHILKNEIVNETIEDIKIVNLKIIGSRKTTNYREDSDLDILVEYKCNLKEYIVFNMLNELGLEYDNLVLDFFPIKKE